MNIEYIGFGIIIGFFIAYIIMAVNYNWYYDCYHKISEYTEMKNDKNYQKIKDWLQKGKNGEFTNAYLSSKEYNDNIFILIGIIRNEINKIYKDSKIFDFEIVIKATDFLKTNTRDEFKIIYNKNIKDYMSNVQSINIPII